MKIKLTIEGEIQILELTLKEINKVTNRGICSCMEEAIYGLYGYISSEELFRLFPDFIKYHPIYCSGVRKDLINYSELNYWFSLDELGQRSRIKILKKMIAKRKKLLKKK